MTKYGIFLVLYKIFFSILAMSAIITEIIVLTHRQQLSFSNFFSFFTIESNLFAAIILLFSATAVVFRKRTDSRLTMLRGAATLYMVITGIVFSVLLAGLEASVLTAVPWDNIVLHYIMPVAVLVDWVIDNATDRLPLRRAFVWLAYPIFYVVYSLIRGNLVEWYPYPFLNPSVNGIGYVLFISVGIAILAVVLTWLLVSIPKKIKH
jgi:hypothetical protein